jgi:hypothetical protein
MSTYSFNENDLNFFQKAVCLKSVSFEEASLSTVGTVTKCLIIFVLLIVIGTCAMNIVSNFEILNKPDDQRDISKNYCIALLVFNFIVLGLSLLLAFFIIKAFWTDARNKKAVKNALLKAKLEGAEEGVKIGVDEAFAFIENDVSVSLQEKVASISEKFANRPSGPEFTDLLQGISSKIEREIKKNSNSIIISATNSVKNFIEETDIGGSAGSFRAANKIVPGSAGSFRAANKIVPGSAGVSLSVPPPVGGSTRNVGFVIPE